MAEGEKAAKYIFFLRYEAEKYVTILIPFNVIVSIRTNIIA